MNPSGPVEQVELARAQKPQVAVDTVEKEAAMSKNTFVTVEEDALSFGSEEPTEEDLATLKRVSGTIPWTAYTIAFVEFCERFSYYGTTVVCRFGSTFITTYLMVKPDLANGTSCQFHSAAPSTW